MCPRGVLSAPTCLCLRVSPGILVMLASFSCDQSGRAVTSRGGDLTTVGVTPASLVIVIAPFLPFFSMPYSRVATSCSSPGEICGCVNGVPNTARDPHRSAQVLC